jgi:signal transduction histidine kinase
MPRTTYHHLRTRLQLTFASKRATGTRQSSGLQLWIKSVERSPGPPGQDSEPFVQDRSTIGATKKRCCKWPLPIEIQDLQPVRGANALTGARSGPVEGTMSQTGAPLVGSYDYGEVARSILIAFAASYAAFDLGGRVTAARGWVRAAWLTGGAIAMGIGIWSMHFKALLAFRLPVKVEYHWPTVLASLVIAVLASAIALYTATREKMGTTQAWAGSVIMGGGIAVVHYLGLAAMRLPATTRFEPLLVALSVVLAILFSRLALAFTFDRREDFGGTTLAKVISAAVMGAAISLMHYSGMAAVSFLPAAVFTILSHTVSMSPIGGYGIVIITFLVLGSAILTSSVDRQTQAEVQRLNERLEQRVVERTRQLTAANEELRRLSGQLLLLQDEERRRIARDLHDSTGQDLVALATTLSQLRASIPSSSRRLRKVASECQALAEQCIREIRTLSYLLHPPMLEEAGLEDAIRLFVEGFTKRSAIQVELEVSPQLGRLDADAELTLFRVVQESLNNVRRHSGSPRAKIRVARNPQEITLEVSDAGRGISEKQSMQDGEIPFKLGVGIPSMQERVKLIGGQLTIDSSSSGTIVRVTIRINERTH